MKVKHETDSGISFLGQLIYSCAWIYSCDRIFIHVTENVFLWCDLHSSDRKNILVIVYLFLRF